MPLFTRELNELADRIGRSDLTIYLHTAAPSDSDPDNGRVTVGGGNYESGATLAASDISDASSGDIQNDAAVAFGTADENIGDVTHWSALRGTDAVAYGSLTDVTINDGDSYTIPIGEIQFNGTTT